MPIWFQKNIYNSKGLMFGLAVLIILRFINDDSLLGIPSFAFFCLFVIFGLMFGRRGLETRESDKEGELMMSFFDLLWILTSLITLFFLYQDLYGKGMLGGLSIPALRAGWLSPWFFFLGLRLSKALFDIHIRFEKINPKYQDNIYLIKIEDDKPKASLCFLTLIIISCFLLPPFALLVILNSKAVHSPFSSLKHSIIFSFIWYIGRPFKTDE